MSGMRPNAVGWGLVAFFLIGGIYFATSGGVLATMGTIWIVVALALAAFYGLMIARGRAGQELRERGLSGKAIITGLTDTGTTVNEQPMVKLDLEMHVEGLPQYSVSKRMIVPRIAVGQLTSGAGLPVKVDPQNRNKFVIEWGAQTAPAGASGSGFGGGDSAVDARLQKLSELRSSGAISDGEYEAERKRILAEI